MGTISRRVTYYLSRRTDVHGGCSLLLDVPKVKRIITLRAVVLARGFATVAGPEGCTYCVNVTPFPGRSKASIEGHASISYGKFSGTGTSLSVSTISTVARDPALERC